MAGNPILWMKEYIRDELNSVCEENDWSFGIIHEISHNFDHEIWNFDAEHFSNLKLCYALEKLNGKVRYHYNEFLTGKDIVQIFENEKTIVLNHYKETGEYYNFNDFLTYWFLEIKNETGWEPFQKTFYHLLNQNPGDSHYSRNQKFDLFMNTLQAFTGKDIWAIIPEEDLLLIREYLDRI